jgi:hypothetical protein
LDLIEQSCSLYKQGRNTDATYQDQYKREDTNDKPALDLTTGRRWGRKRGLLLRKINAIRIREAIGVHFIRVWWHSRRW